MLCGIPPYFSNNRDQLFFNIKNARLTFPKRISEVSQDLLKKLLNRDPNERLGCRGAIEIKNHPYFENVDWNSVYKRELKPPKPTIKSIPTKRIQPRESTVAIENGHLDGWTFISHM